MMQLFKPKEERDIVNTQEKMTQAYKAFGEEESDDIIDASPVYPALLALRHGAHIIPVSEQSFGSDLSAYYIPLSGNADKFNPLLVTGVHGASTRSISSNESMTNDLSNLITGGVLGLEDSPPEAGHARKIKLYLERLDNGLPPNDHSAQSRQPAGVFSQLRIRLREKLESTDVVDPELQDEPTFRGWAAKTFVVCVALAFAIGVFVTAQAYEVELSDMTKHGMLLMMLALCITIVLL